jgi:hypothetical protein
MLENMASLRPAMEEMDAQDPATSLAAKDRAAQILKDHDLNFTKMAELIERRQLLLRPKILASMKRMDHEMLGEASFRETSNALRREGQSFRQIADALELNRGLAPQHEDSLHRSEPSHEMAIEPDSGAPRRAANVLASILFFPLRHPFWFLVVAPAAVGLIYIVSSLVITDRPRLGGTPAVVSATPSCPSPSCSASPSATPSATSSATFAGTPPTTTPTPSANAPTSLPPTASTCPPTSTSSRNAYGAPSSKSTVNDCTQMTPSPIFGSLIPARYRRNSISAGRCVGGVGGCRWGGGQF